MLKPFTILLLSSSLASALFSNYSFAGKEDSTKKIELSSLYQQADGIAKKAFYQGNVVITQGTLKVKADELEVDANKGEGREIFIAKGKPAEFSQQQEDGSMVTAKADRIEYRRESQTLSLTGNAEIEQNAVSTKGSSIIFNMELEQVEAQGSDRDSGRVVTTFQPVSKASKPEEKKQEEKP